MDRRHDGNAEIHEAAFVTHAEAAVLRDAALGDIQLAHHLDARKNRGVPFLGERLHGVLQHAVNAVLHDDFGVARFDVDVAGAALERRENHGIHQADDGAHAGFARELLHRNIFVAVFLVADDLQREPFGGLIQHALRLLGALQQIANLRSGGDADLQALAQQEREFVGELQLAGIGHGDHQGGVVGLQRHEFVAEHQFGRDAAEKIGIDALLAQIHERATIALGEPARLIALGGLVRHAWNDRIVRRCSHGT